MSALWDWITGYDAENAARAAAADAELRRMADETYIRPGGRRYTPEHAERVAANYETDAFLGEDAARAAIGDAFDEGWEEGRENVSGFIAGAANKVVGGPLRAILGGIPWWVWLAAGIYVAWRLGFLEKLLKRAA